MIEAVLFDFGQTLVDSAAGFRAAEREAQRRLFAELDGVTWEAFIDRYRRTRKALHDQSRISRFEIWREVCEAFDRAPDAARLAGWEREYWRTVNRHTAPFPEAIGVLERLRRDYRLGLVSNAQGEVAGEGHRLREFPELARLFEVAVIAGENGVRAKPDPQPFRLCLERLGVAPQAAVYVGDDYRVDIEGATAVGLRPVWLKHRAVVRNWPEVKTTVPVVTSLEALLDPAVLKPVEYKKVAGYGHDNT